MFSRLREPFGKAGLIVVVVALVFALVGGAYAASSPSDGDATASAKNKRNTNKGKQGGLNAKQKRQVIALAKRFASAGPQGPQGVPGLPGAPGAKGADGNDGSDGSDGSNGASATVANEPPGVNCGFGGIKVSSARPDAFVCNGADGSNGGNGTSATVANESPGANCQQGGIKVSSASPDAYVCNGSPWTAGGTLPVGSTETGTFGATGNTSSAADYGGSIGKVISAPISFNVPLASPVTTGKGIFVPAGDTTTAHCSAAPINGTVSDPKAESGYLCVYASSAAGMTIHPLVGITAEFVAGAFINLQPTSATKSAMSGTWAVTG